MNNPDHPLNLYSDEIMPEISDIKKVVTETQYFTPDYLHYFSLLEPQQQSPLISCPNVRLEIVDLVFKIGSQIKLSQETVHVAILIFDLSVATLPNFFLSSFKIYAIASVLIACKSLEKTAIKANRINRFFDYQYKISEIVKAELSILKAIKYRIPSIGLYQWTSFLLDEWDRYIREVFNAGDLSSDFWESKDERTDLMLFRHPDRVSYKRFRNVMALVDLIAMSASYYLFDHRLVAIAILWKSVYQEFIHENAQFYLKYGIPGVVCLFEGTNNKDFACDWLLDLLMQFSNLYIGEKTNELGEIFEFIDLFIHDARKRKLGDEETAYLRKKKDGSERNYNELLSLQTYSPSYFAISKRLQN